MIYDLVIRRGTILDGSGREPFTGDIAVLDGVIHAVGHVAGEGREEMDATGRLITPGFIDIHTHYDGQATWEHQLKPSSEYGVTTAVMGNCGVGFAPCEPNERELLAKVMEGVEDIPEIVITDGVPWQWRTFPEYLDFLACRHYDADIAAYVPHVALRVFVMGERSTCGTPATPDDLERMRRLVAEAIDAGAVGVSTSRSLSHLDSDGKQAPHVHAANEELMALARGLKDAGRGLFQLAAGLTGQQLKGYMADASKRTMEHALRQEIALYSEICRVSSRPLTFSLAGVNDEADMIPRALELVAAANREDAVQIMPQIFPRPIGLLFGLDLSLNPFTFHPGYRELEHLPLRERVAAMRRPQTRARILADNAESSGANPMHRFLVTRSLDAYPFTDAVDYEPDPATSLKAIARREGKTTADVAYDALLANEGKGVLFLPINNFAGDNLDDVFAMLASDDTLIGLGDGGAHYGFICDSSFPVFLLTYWARDRRKGNGRRIALPDAVNRLTRRNAVAVGLDDRGLLAPGKKADINILDYKNLRLAVPEVNFDLPGGGRRLTQKVAGIEATIVSGKLTYRNGVPTGTSPGRLVRVNAIEKHQSIT